MLKELLNYWWLYLVKGIIAILFGLLAITVPEKTVLLLAVLFGLYLLIDGIISSIQAVVSAGKGKNWMITLLLGVLEIFLGILVVTYPAMTAGVLTFLIALWFILSGIIIFVVGIKVRDDREDEWLLMAYGIAALFFGILIFSNPQATVLFVTVLYGIGAVLAGILYIAFGFKVKELKDRNIGVQEELPL